MTEAGIAEQATRNGHAGDGEAPRGLAARLVASMRDQVQLRIPRADLDERDPDYIRENLPRLWLAASPGVRGEGPGLGNIPEQGGGLLGGNHSCRHPPPDPTAVPLALP